MGCIWHKLTFFCHYDNIIATKINIEKLLTT
nr:MAG TPA: hypothetical protein [Caudoviricetes sp.]